MWDRCACDRPISERGAACARDSALAWPARGPVTPSRGTTELSFAAPTCGRRAPSSVEDRPAGAVAGPRAEVVRRVEARQPRAALVVRGAGLSGARAAAALARSAGRARWDRTRVAGAAVGGRGAHRALRLACRGCL